MCLKVRRYNVSIVVFIKEYIEKEIGKIYKKIFELILVFDVFS